MYTSLHSALQRQSLRVSMGQDTECPGTLLWPLSTSQLLTGPRCTHLNCRTESNYVSVIKEQIRVVTSILKGNRTTLLGYHQEHAGLVVAMVRGFTPRNAKALSWCATCVTPTPSQ